MALLRQILAEPLAHLLFWSVVTIGLYGVAKRALPQMAALVADAARRRADPHRRRHSRAARLLPGLYPRHEVAGAAARPGDRRFRHSDLRAARPHSPPLAGAASRHGGGHAGVARLELGIGDAGRPRRNAAAEPAAALDQHALRDGSLRRHRRRSRPDRGVRRRDRRRRRGHRRSRSSRGCRSSRRSRAARCSASARTALARRAPIRSARPKGPCRGSSWCWSAFSTFSPRRCSPTPSDSAEARAPLRRRRMDIGDADSILLSSVARAFARRRGQRRRRQS